MTERNYERPRKHIARRCASALLVFLCAAAGTSAQKAPPVAGDVATALTGALSAACKEDDTAFAPYLTSENATEFQNLVGPQRTAFMKRVVQLDDPGRPLISTSDDGLPVLRCETPAISTDMRFGPTKISDNLAFIAVTVPSPGEDPRTIRFGLVREQGQWKLLSLGLVLLDVQALSEEWARADIEEMCIRDRYCPTVQILRLMHQLLSRITTCDASFISVTIRKRRGTAVGGVEPFSASTFNGPII